MHIKIHKRVHNDGILTGVIMVKHKLFPIPRLQQWGNLRIQYVLGDLKVMDFEIFWLTDKARPS